MSDSESENSVQLEEEVETTNLIPDQERKLKEEEREIQLEKEAGEGLRLIRKRTLELIKNPSKELLEQPTLELIKQSSKEPVRQSSKELTRQPSKDLMRQPSKDFTKQPSLKKQPSKELGKQIEEEAAEEPAKEEAKGFKAGCTKAVRVMKLFPLTFVLIRPQIFLFAVTYSLSLIDTGLDTLGSFYTGNIVDIVTRSKDMGDLRKLVTHMLIYCVVSQLVGRISSMTRTKSSDAFGNNVKGVLYRKLLDQNMAFYDKISPHQASTALSEGVDALESFYLYQFIWLLQDLVMMIGSLWLMHMTCPRLAMIVYIVTPVKLVLTFFSVNDGRDWDKWDKFESDIKSLCTQSIQNITLVKAFSTEHKEHKDLVDKEKGFNEFKSEKFLPLWTIVTLMEHGLSAILVWFGGMMVFQGTITPGELSTFNICYSRFASRFYGINYALKRFFESFMKSELILKVLEADKASKAKQQSKNITKSNLKGCVSIRNVCFSYPSKPEVEVLSNLNIDVNAGEAVAFVGASGSGKTTLMNLIMNLYTPTKGEIIIDEEPINDFNRKWLHQQIGYVSQEPVLLDRTVEENIAYGLDTWTPEQIEKAVALSNSKFILHKEKFPDGLKTKIGPEGIKLSGGQKQRIAIARAFVKNPKILILDEPTSALDGESESKVQKAIDELISLGDRTVIVVAHRLSTIINCSKIVVFDDGRIVEVGSHRELIEKNGVYKKLFEFQLENLKKL